MRVTSLGWAGFELEHEDAVLLIDPLLDPTALYTAVGDAAAGVEWPQLVAPTARHTAVGALVTHLHRDHADAPALAGALAPNAPVLVPAEPSRDGADAPGLAAAQHALDRERLTLRPVLPWETAALGPFSVIALPAVDGTGEPQVSWAIEAGGTRVVHCGDTTFHGSWWHVARIAGGVDLALLPVNGAVVSFPWRRPASPLPAVMTPEQAAVAARLLRASTAVPMHYGGFDLDPFYRSIPDAATRFLAAAEVERVNASLLGAGETFEIAAPVNRALA